MGGRRGDRGGKLKRNLLLTGIYGNAEEENKMSLQL